MDNVGIVVESLDQAISVFQEIGLKLEGRVMVEGEWAGRVTGLGDQSVEIAMMVTPDGHSRLELSQFFRPMGLHVWTLITTEILQMLARQRRFPTERQLAIWESSSVLLRKTQMTGSSISI